MSTSTSSEISFFRPAGRVDCEIAVGILPFLYDEQCLGLDSGWPSYFLTKLKESFGVNRIISICSDAEYFASRLPELDSYSKKFDVEMVRLPVLSVSGFSELSLSNLLSLSSYIAQSNGEIGRTLLVCSLDGGRSTALVGAMSICLGAHVENILPRLRMLRSTAFETPQVEKFLRGLYEYVDEQRNTADSITWEFKNTKVFHAGNVSEFFSSSEMDVILSADRSIVPVDLTAAERHKLANSTYEINLTGSRLAQQLNLDLKPLYLEPGSHSSYLKALLPAAMDVLDPSAGFVTYVINRPGGLDDGEADEYVDSTMRKIQGLMEALDLFCATAQVHYRSPYPGSRSKSTRSVLAGPMRSSRAIEFALMYKIDGFLFSGMKETSRYINCKVR